LPFKLIEVQIAKHTKATLSYELTVAKEDTLITRVSEDNPAEFIFGENQLLPMFEANLLGLHPGDAFDFEVKAADAYGPTDPYAIFDIPKETFEVDGKTDDQMLKAGNTIPMTDNEGNKHMGRITRVMEEAITMDFNHPLAGKDLRFKGKIIDVKESI
jgi:FKBP-type peptidyl-prolyl cis-trans isomerase SlyD